MEKKGKKHNKIKNHHRVNDILLGPLERPAIAWLVERMPQWVTPDHLTFLGFAAAILIGVSYYLTNFNKNYFWLADLGFLLNWFGDSLDGNLARFRKTERPRYGFFIDHTVDTISEICIFIGIGLSPYVDLNLALLALVGYLSMASLVYITTSVEGEFKISYGKLGPTEARVIAMMANTIIYFIGNPLLNLIWFDIYLYNLILIFIITLLFFFFITSVITQAIKYERKDRKKYLKKMQKKKKSQINSE
jgi:archaetidylinositol phosphate synthase